MNSSGGGEEAKEACGQKHDGGTKGDGRILEMTWWENIRTDRQMFSVPSQHLDLFLSLPGSHTT
jgi:hypothetical protein